VKAGSVNALGAYCTLTAKREKVQVTGKDRQMTLFSSPSPRIFPPRPDCLLFKTSQPAYHEPTDERRTTILEIAEENGISLLYSPDLDSATRSLLKRTGAETIFYRGGDIKTAGFVSERDASPYFAGIITST